MEHGKPNSVSLSPLVDNEDIAVEFRTDHVHIQIGKGLHVTNEHRNELWTLIGRLCQEYETRRVLVEGRVPDGVFQTSEVVDAGLKTATVPSLWMAFCFEGFKPDDLSELYETVAASRGVRVKHFANTQRALMWLRNNTPS